MNSGIAVLENCYEYLLTGTLIFLAIMLVLCLVRACIGPTIADRLVSVNMMGTMVMVMIAILGIRLNEGYLVDICIIYAMISFLSVIVLTKVYTGVYNEEKEHEAEEKLNNVTDIKVNNKTNTNNTENNRTKIIEGGVTNGNS